MKNNIILKTIEFTRANNNNYGVSDNNNKITKNKVLMRVL